MALRTLGAWYKIMKTAIPASRLAKARPTAKIETDKNKPAITILLYKESATHLSVGRHFGHSMFGKAKDEDLTDGAEMNAEVRFTGTLRDTTDSPQQRALATITKHWAKAPYCGIVKCSPGFGKTVLAVAACVHRRRSAIILVHTSVLFDQWLERIRMFAPLARVGRIRQNVCETEDCDIVVAMLHSVHARDYKGLDRFGTVIVDEAHHIAAATFLSSLLKFKARCILGLSATPERRDALAPAVHMFLGPIIFAHDSTNIPVQVNMVRYKSAEKYNRAIKDPKSHFGRLRAFKRLSNDVLRNAYIVDQVVRWVTEEDRNVLVLTQLIDHAQSLHTDITAQLPGTVTGLMIGKTKKKDREHILADAQVICANYHLAKEGMDVKRLNAMVLALPAGGPVQYVGRIQREAGRCTPKIMDIWDDMGIADGMGWGRKMFYQKRNFDIEETTLD